VDQPPGLYWYHPHLHGFSKAQVLGGASGALIVEGIERVNSEVAGLPERILIVRDQDLLNPNAPPSSSDTNAPPVVLDLDGDARNTGSGTGKPAKDLSLNFVPVPYPDYQPAKIEMKPAERQLWRVLNASAITYLNLQLILRGAPQGFGVVGLDGVPIKLNRSGGNGVVWQNHLGLPPGGRAEFILTAPPDGLKEILLTRSVNTGAGGENDPVRPLATIVSTKDSRDPQSRLTASPEPLARPSLPWLGTVTPARTRKLYFSEVLQDPKDPNSPTTFFITVDGATPVLFDPNAAIPNIVVRQGDVEDWIIENRSQELHAFHIHQIHFMLTEWFGVPVNEPFLRDTINVPFWDGKSAKFPSVRLRMDFRNPEIVGTFPYHCHLLEHEDGGMMGLVRVEPSQQSQTHPAPVPMEAPHGGERK
jgi:FtsP/CotA-like multicopper oxidase with cupredoxin domain